MILRTQMAEAGTASEEAALVAAYVYASASTPPSLKILSLASSVDGLKGLVVFEDSVDEVK